jgi:hypothetical protein
MDTAHAVLKVLLTLLLAAVGTLALLSAAGVLPLPDALRLSDVDGKDKWARGAALLGLPVAAFTAALGAAKLTAAAGFWLGRGIDETVTLLAAAMYVCVSVGHYKIDGAYLPPLIPAALCLAKWATTPAPPVKTSKSKL